MDSATRVTIISTDCSLQKELESAEFCWWLINIYSAILFLVKLDGRFEFDSRALARPRPLFKEVRTAPRRSPLPIFHRW